MEERRTSTAWDSADPSLHHQWSPVSRHSRRSQLSSSRVLLRVGVVAGLVCVATVAILGSLRDGDARPIEDYIPAASSGSGPAAAKAAGQTYTPTWIRDAVEKAVGNAAKEARADLKGVVKTAVEDAVEETIKTDKKMSGIALVNQMVRNSAQVGEQVAKKESAKYDADFKHVASTISSQITALVDPSSSSSSSSSSASPSHASSAGGGGGRGRHEQEWVKLASQVLHAQDAKGEQRRAEEAAKEKAREQQEYKAEQREYHLLEKGIKHQTEDIRAGHPIVKKKVVPLYDPKAEAKADDEASKDLQTLKSLLPKKAPMKTFHKSAAEEARKAKEEAKAEALARSEEQKDAKTTDNVFPRSFKKVTLQTKRVSDGEGKNKIPISSKQNPHYIKGEDKRNTEAQKDLETLRRLRKIKKEMEAKRKAQDAAVIKQAEDRTAIADKYLKEMEHKAKSKKSPPKKHVDRSVLAEHMLHRLEKLGKAFFGGTSGTSAKIPPTSRHAPAYKEAQAHRNAEAMRDMKLLKKGIALVKKGSAVVPVKLSPDIVHGVDKVAKERAQLTKGHPRGPDRNQLAQEFLKHLEKEPQNMKEVGKPFHGYKVASSLLRPKPSDMNEKAQKYLKQLQAANPKPPPPPPPTSRSLIAQHDLKKLEHKIGHAPTPKFGSDQKKLTADSLAEQDLKTLKTYPAPKTNPK